MRFPRLPWKVAGDLRLVNKLLKRSGKDARRKPARSLFHPPCRAACATVNEPERVVLSQIVRKCIIREVESMAAAKIRRRRCRPSFQARARAPARNFLPAIRSTNGCGDHFRMDVMTKSSKGPPPPQFAVADNETAAACRRNVVKVHVATLFRRSVHDRAALPG